MLAAITASKLRQTLTRDVDGQNCHKGPGQCEVDKRGRRNGQIHQEALARNPQWIEHEKSIVSTGISDHKP